MITKCFSPLLFVCFMSACTQLPPPVSGKNQSSSEPGESGTSVETFLTLSDPSQDGVELILSGEDAGKIYRLLALSPEESASQGEKIKVGRDFSCTYGKPKQSCEFFIRLPAGEFAVQRQEQDLKRAAAEMPQIKESDAYISISDPSERGKVRLQVLDAYAEKIFNALQTERTFDLTPDSVNGPGVRKAAKQVDCYQRSKASTPEKKTYDCYLFLNTESGTIEPVDPSVQQ